MTLAAEIDVLALSSQIKTVAMKDAFSTIANGMNVRQDREGTGLPISRIETISDGRINLAKCGYAGISVSEAERWCLRAGEILFSHINSPEQVGKCALVEAEHLPLVHGMNLLRLVPRPEVLDSRFALHYLRAGAFRSQLRRFVNQAVNQASVSISNLKTLELGLPPLDEQRRIAAILDKADELRTKRRQAIAQLDALTQSIFQATVEDAGALLPAMTLADLGLTFTSGKNLISSDGDAHERNRVIKVNAVSGGIFQPSESKPLPRTYIPKEQHRIRTGDLLFTRASGSLDLIGVCARVREAGAHLFLPDKIWRAELTPGAKVCPEYLQSLFRTPAFRAFVNNAASGAAGVKNISQRSVLGFVVSAPEPAAQEEFAKHVNAIELLKDRHSAQLAELDALFAVLQHRAFKGELR